MENRSDLTGVDWFALTAFYMKCKGLSCLIMDL